MEETTSHPDYHVAFSLNLFVLAAVIGHLQLALRHPGAIGPAAQLVRRVIDAAIARVAAGGLVHTAALLRKGDDPASDLGPVS